MVIKATVVPNGALVNSALTILSEGGYSAFLHLNLLFCKPIIITSDSVDKVQENNYRDRFPDLSLQLLLSNGAKTGFDSTVTE